MFQWNTSKFCYYFICIKENTCSSFFIFHFMQYRANSMNTKIQFLKSITSYDMCDNVKGGTSNINNIEGWKLKKSTKNYKTALNLFFPLLQVCTFQPFLAQCILYARHNRYVFSLPLKMIIHLKVGHHQKVLKQWEFIIGRFSASG